jgi:hypothetical protein
LELFPGLAYGKAWLKVVDGSGREMWSFAGNSGSALESIYVQPPDAWWRLVNPNWVNPGRVKKADGGGIDAVVKRLKEAT